MDCECSEWEIVDQTDPRQFKRFPVLLVEVHGDPGKRHQVNEFKEMTQKLGFRTIRWDGKYHGLYLGVRR